MRVADRRSTEDELPTAHGQFFVNHFTSRPSNRNLVANESDLAHFYTHHFAVVEHGGFHHATGGFNGKFIRANEFLIPKVARKDAKTVAAFLRLAAIRVENA